MDKVKVAMVVRVWVVDPQASDKTTRADSRSEALVSVCSKWVTLEAEVNKEATGRVGKEAMGKVNKGVMAEVNNKEAMEEVSKEATAGNSRVATAEANSSTATATPAAHLTAAA